jgi:hypothetical protein
MKESQHHCKYAWIKLECVYLFHITIFTWCVLELLGPVQDLRVLNSKYEAVNKATRLL